MKEVFINHDYLRKEDIDEVVVRVKGLIINDENEIMLGYAHHTYQFPGGHLKEGEELVEGLVREIREETGIVIQDKDLKPFEKITYYVKNYRDKGINRENDIYYYVIYTNDLYNRDNTFLDDWEKLGNYTAKYYPLDDVEKILFGSILDDPLNKIIVEEMLEVLGEYKRICL